MTLHNKGTRNSWPYEPNSPFPTRRRYSTILSNFPWAWDGIVRDPQDLEQFANKIPKFKHFIRSLVSFEKQTFSIGSTQAASGLLAVLGVQIEHNVSLIEHPQVISRHKEGLTTGDFQRLASVIAAYSFFEVIALRANVISRVPPSPELTTFYLPPSKTKVQQELHGWRDVANWFNVLFHFRKIMTKLSAIDDNMQTLKSQSSPVHITLLRMIGRSNTTNDYHRIENNMLYAALHINSMQNVVFPTGQVPDLPKDLHKGKHRFHVDLEKISSEGRTVPSEGRSLLETAVEDAPVLDELRNALPRSSGGLAMLRNALHVSEILTPLFLILPRQLIKVSFHRRTLLELAAKMRPCKPAVLLKIEDLIWDALFALSQGSVTPYEVLQKLLRNIPWEQVEAAAAAPREYSLTALHADASRADLISDSSSLSENDGQPAGKNGHYDGLPLESSSISTVLEKTCPEQGLKSTLPVIKQSGTQLSSPLDEDIVMSALADSQHLGNEELDRGSLLSTQLLVPSSSVPVASCLGFHSWDFFNVTMTELQEQAACGLTCPVESGQAFLRPDAFAWPDVAKDLDFQPGLLFDDLGSSLNPHLPEDETGKTPS